MGDFRVCFYILLYRSSINSQHNTQHTHARSLCKYTLAPQTNCRSVCPSVHPSICLSVYVHVGLSMSTSVRLRTCLSICLHTNLSIYDHVFTSVCPSVCIHVCSSVLPSFHPSTRVCVCLVRVRLSSSGGHPARDPSLTVGKRGGEHTIKVSSFFHSIIPTALNLTRGAPCKCQSGMANSCVLLS